MSLEVYVAVLEADIDDPSLKSVLLGMANHAGPDGSHCFPSVRRLQAYTGLGESTIRRKLSTARDRNLIKIVRKASAQKPTEYWVNLTLLRSLKHPTLVEMDAEREWQYENADPSRSETPPAMRPLPSRSERDPSRSERDPSRSGRQTVINRKEPSEEPSVKHTVTNALRKHADTVFREVTSLEPSGDKKEQGKRWHQPLRRICVLVLDAELGTPEDNVEALIRAVVRHMDVEGLDYDSPASIEKVCRSMVAKAKRGVYKPPKPSLDEMADSYARRMNGDG